jgi:hypothetical protein
MGFRLATLALLVLPHRTHDGELPGAPPTIGLRSSGPSMDLGAAGPSRRSLMIDIFSSGRKVGGGTEVEVWLRCVRCLQLANRVQPGILPVVMPVD